MPHIPDIPLSKIKCHDSWTDAPEGAILQMDAKGKPVVVMRGKMMPVRPPSDCLIALEGSDIGTIFHKEEIGYAHAIDITDLVTLNVHDPSPIVAQNATKTPGLLFLTETNEIYMPVESNGYRWVACIHGQTPGQIKQAADGIKTCLGSLSVLEKNEPTQS